MKRPLFAALALSASMLAACETATPYQPLGAPGAKASGGYFDRQIETNRWQVGFKGNDLTSRETVERYLLYRSAELALTQGYDWFEAVDRHTDKKTDTYATPDPYDAGYGGGFGYGGFGGYWGPRWGLYRRGFGWRYGYGDPFWGPGPVDYTQVNQFQATAEVLFGHGQKPNDRQAFDAHSVIAHLAGSIQPPKT